MNCKTFMKKLPDLMENNMMHDMRDAMQRHMDNCEACRSTYEEEKSFDDAFIKALQFEGIKFNSARAEIIKSIDKNRYGKSPLKKMKYGLSKFRWQLVSSAAVLVMAITIAPHIIGMGTAEKNQYNSAMQITGTESIKENVTTNQMVIENNAESTDQAVSEKRHVALNIEPLPFSLFVKSEKAYVPEFNRVAMDKLPEPEFGTTWKKSPDETAEVSINGRGINAAEEGIADLIFLNKLDSKMWKLSLTKNEKKQFTPMFVDWFDNENVMVTMGYGHGTVTFGGDLILLNINTGKAVNIYPENSVDSKVQVISAVRKENTLELKVRKYKDSTMNSFNDEDRRILFYEVYPVGNTQMDGKKEPTGNDIVISNLKLLTTSINEKNQKSVYSVFSEEVIKSEEYTGLSQVERMELKRILSLSNADEMVETPKTFYVELDVKMSKETNLYKNGHNFLAISMMRDKNGAVVITEINRLPQN